MIRLRAYAKSLMFFQWKRVCRFSIIGSSRSFLKCDTQMQEMREQRGKKKTSNGEADCWKDPIS